VKKKKTTKIDFANDYVRHFKAPKYYKLGQASIELNKQFGDKILTILLQKTRTEKLKTVWG